MKNISFRNDVLPLKNQLYRLALHITLNAAEAEDVVQETLIRVWNKRDEWQNIDSIEAFSFTICRNISLDSIRKRGNNNSSLDSSNVERADESTDPSDYAEQSDSVEMVKRIVESLPEKQRSCMQLRDFEGKPYKEIADVLGISEEQVKVNIFRARQTVKERFNKLNSYGL
jgi:RNA polymerase sigma-70 factor (ECF subfamily)